MQASDKPSNILLKSLLGRSLLIALPLLVLVNGVIWSAYTLDVGQQRQTWISEVEVELDAAIISIDQLRNDLYGDIRLLSNSPNLHAVLDDANEQRLLALAAEWEIFAAVKRRYDQIRWVDGKGMERLRVNLTPNGAIRVGEEELQDKSARYYFNDAMVLKPGQIYTSPIDLNVENGVIERPFKPMLRVAVPVSDSRGRQRGLLLVNVLAKYILDDLARHASLRQSHMLLLDRTGYYLRGFENDQAWGFMLKRDGDTYHRFDKAYPRVWREMVRNGSGRVDDDAGLFVYRTIKYGSEGFNNSYVLVEALTSDERAALVNGQRSVWFVVSLLVSLALVAMTFALVRCRSAGRRAEAHV